MRTLGNEAGRSEERAARPTCAQVFLFVLVYAMVHVISGFWVPIVTK